MNNTQQDNARNPSPPLNPPPHGAKYLGPLSLPEDATVAEFIGFGIARHGNAFYQAHMLCALREFARHLQENPPSPELEELLKELQDPSHPGACSACND